MPFSLSNISHQAYQSVSNLSASAYQQVRNGASRLNPGSGPLSALERDILLMDHPVQVPRSSVLGNSPALQRESYLRELASDPILMNLYRLNNFLHSWNPFRGTSTQEKVKAALLTTEMHKAALLAAEKNKEAVRAAHSEASKEVKAALPLRLAETGMLKYFTGKAANCAEKAENAMSVALAHPDKSKSDQAWKDVNYLLQAGVDPNPAIVSFALKRKEAINSGQLGSLKINKPDLVAQ